MALINDLEMNADLDKQAKDAIVGGARSYYDSGWRKGSTSVRNYRAASTRRYSRGRWRYIQTRYAHYRVTTQRWFRTVTRGWTV